MQKTILKINLTKNEYASVLQLTDVTNLLLKQGQKAFQEHTQL